MSQELEEIAAPRDERSVTSTGDGLVLWPRDFSPDGGRLAGLVPEGSVLV